MFSHYGRDQMKKAIAMLGASAALIGGVVVATSVQAGPVPVQDCEASTGVWYSNSFPGETNNVVSGFRQEGDQFEVRTENTGTQANGVPHSKTIQCSSNSTQWELFLSRLGDRSDTARVDAVGLDQPGFGPVPSRIEVRLFGEEGRDTLVAHGGKNKLKGGRGSDELRSLAGKDLLVGGPARDLIFAGAGRDLIRAADEKSDEVRCGGGQDTAKVDPSDDVSGCETVRVR
jgi:Ca2+-binding RTX toxin-like protein